MAPFQRIAVSGRRPLLLASLTLAVLTLCFLAFGVSQPTKTVTATSHVLSQGVAAHGSDVWAAAGYKGQMPGSENVKVGIIDLGFNGFDGRPSDATLVVCSTLALV